MAFAALGDEVFSRSGAGGATPQLLQKQGDLEARGLMKGGAGAPRGVTLAGMMQAVHGMLQPQPILIGKEKAYEQ